jgi:hypothetical protein
LKHPLKEKVVDELKTERDEVGRSRADENALAGNKEVINIGEILEWQPREAPFGNPQASRESNTLKYLLFRAQTLRLRIHVSAPSLMSLEQPHSKLPSEATPVSRMNGSIDAAQAFHRKLQIPAPQHHH